MPDGGETPMPGSGDAGDATPARPTNRLLDVEDATRASSRAASPSRHSAETLGDVEMAESVQVPPAKTSTGMEASVAQVVEPAEGVTDKMDET